MTEDMIDTFRNTTPEVNQEFLRKSQFETSTCHKCLILEKLTRQSSIFKLRRLAAQCLRSLHSTGQKELVFDRLHKRTIVSEDVKS